MPERLDFSVLGPLRVDAAGAAVALGGPKQRCVLALLLVDANRVVSVDRLIDGVWGDEPHDRAASTLQVYVSNLRKALGADRIVTERPGYRIVVAPDELDLARFEAAERAGHAHLAAGRADDAAAAFADALDAWQGPALADLEHEPFAAGVVAGLNERRETAWDASIDAQLQMGRHRELIAGLERAVAETPLRERRWAQLMLALYRSGRQADALAAFGTARSTLVEELGIDPGAELRSLEAAVLAQDPALDWDAEAAAADRGRAPAVPSESPASSGATTTIRRAPDGSTALLTLPNGSRLELTERDWSIGRSADNDVVLAAPDVSRRHAVLRLGEGGWTVSDLGSTNGIEVNGTAATEHLLADGDEIVVGRFHLLFSAPQTGTT